MVLDRSRGECTWSSAGSPRPSSVVRSCMNRHASVWTRAWRGAIFALARPSMMVILAAALSYELTTLPVDPIRDGGESVAGRVIARAIAGKNQVVYAGTREIAVFLVRSPGSETGFDVIDPDQESMDRAVRMLREAPEQIAPVGVLAKPVARGLWRPTRVDYNWSLRPPKSWTDEDLSLATRSLAQYLERQNAADLTALARAITDQRLSRVRWIGYAHNTLDAALLCGFVFSCGWLVPNSGWRVRRALRDTRCPSCGYSLRNLEPQRDGDPRVQCPECGSSWNAGA